MNAAQFRQAKLVAVGISELGVTANADESLITYSLGSCAGVSLMDPVTGTGGMIHCMLPLSSNDPERARQVPAMYVDTGLVQLLQRMFEAGVERKHILCKVAGCGAPADSDGVFKIGERNYTVLKKVLWKNNIVIKGECIGGNRPKTMLLELASGKTFVRIDNEWVEL
ncbi:MAG: hypothetical protein A2428_01835 [Bdellovibrionales bacterium RIFOXYC1_FULL_54_43]|nr:MAG: hypothetical protein A2428_01835 [Bdellovibrionales bacterium RIFOXYC1_FULL_54_43]OFZ81680.1 MAG: hypothetical protein A2603_12045 [Bdellovibrionales bacterium RIFOXYD1_FULL_55_31]